MKPAETHFRICAAIDLDAVSYNLDRIYENLNPGTLMTAVIKADGYGHGAVPVARVLEEKPYLWGFAVATVEEALELRAAGIKKPVMLLGYAFPDAFEAIVGNDLRACEFTEENAALLSETAVRMGKKAYIHLAVDTGMSRIGFQINEEQKPLSIETIERIHKMPGLVFEGIFTHFARADETDDAPALAQLKPFTAFVDELKERGMTFPLIHASNSAAALKLSAANLSMVRAGIALYGLSPSCDVRADRFGLRPVMSLTAHISHVKELPEGVPVSYGGTYVTTRRTTVATIPAGYADGYPRQLSNTGCVLVKGQKAPVIGRVCMDQFMIDVTDIPDVVAGDEAVLLGSQGDETITAEEIGALSGRFNYEFVCCINKRVPRIYTQREEITGQVDYFASK